MTNQFSFDLWLQDILTQKGITQAELAKRSSITPAQISRLVSGARGPGKETCLSLARALNIPPETILRVAGFLPTDQTWTPSKDEWSYIFQQLSPDDQAEMLEIARMKLSRRRKAPDTGPLKPRTVEGG
jgi:transcriptional regulator with XRE-family HTH domain